MKLLRLIAITGLLITTFCVLSLTSYIHLMAKRSLEYHGAANKVVLFTYNETKHLQYTSPQWHETNGQDHSGTSFYPVHQASVPTMKEQRHIAFLKVHKAASSTAQNIFLRFAKARNLLVVLPFVPKFFYPNVISTKETVTEQNILPAPGNRFYEILCCHVKYNKAAFARIMPSDTVNIGIVRDPFEHFISTLNYMRPGEVFKINTSDPVSAFLRDPTKYQKRTSMGYTNNRMAFEFDFPVELFETRDPNGIEQYLQKLNSEFKLILIVEMFDESLILMRRLLNWGMKDILYVKLNARRQLYDKITFKSGDVNLYKKWAELDYALYRFFFRRLQVQIQAQGPTFYEELLNFRSIRQDMEIFCKGNLGSNATYHVPASRWSDVFEISKHDCAYMKKGEIPFIKEIRLQQYGVFNDTITPG